MRRDPACSAPSRDSFADAARSYEYLALVGSFVLVGLEAIIRVLTLALRACTPPSHMSATPC